MQENHFPVSCEFPDTFKQNIYYPIKESGPISKCFKNVNLLTTSRVSYQSPSPVFNYHEKCRAMSKNFQKLSLRVTFRVLNPPTYQINAIHILEIEHSNNHSNLRFIILIFQNESTCIRYLKWSSLYTQTRSSKCSLSIIYLSTI